MQNTRPSFPTGASIVTAFHPGAAGSFSNSVSQLLPCVPHDFAGVVENPSGGDCHSPAGSVTDAQ